MSKEELKRESGGVGIFSTTRWSLVVAANTLAGPDKDEALEQLCRIYWKPLYLYLRRKRPFLGAHDAEDCIQSFFADLLERAALGKVVRAKGKFRSFLCASLDNHVNNEWKRTHAQKRGGRFHFVSWEDSDLEQVVSDATSSNLSPDKLLERTWAMALLEQVLSRLQAEQGNKNSQFQALKIFLTGDKGVVPYAEMAKQLGLGESAVKMAVQRLRRRFGEILREEVAQTVSEENEIEQEIRALFAAVST